MFTLTQRPRTDLALISLTLALLAACDGSSNAPSPRGLPSPGLAILNSDYKTSSVSLYDPSAKKLVDDCVTAANLSNDTTLPSGAQGGALVVIDRAMSTIDFVTATTCTGHAKLSVSTGGFHSNPHDVVTLSATKAYVTRYEKNAAATPDPSDFDDGDDVLIIDPSVPKVTGRVDMSAHATQVAGATIEARPDRALLANGLVYVTLNNLSADLMTDAPGRVVAIDPATDAVTATIDLPDQTGCSGMVYADATKRLYVSCGGEFSDADQAAKSALVEIDVSGTTPTLGHILTAKTIGTQPFSLNQAVLLGGNAFVGTAGALDSTTNAMTAPDSLWAVDLTAFTSSKIVDGGAFNLGRPAVDVSTKTLFLPDGDPTKPAVRVFDVSGAAVPGTPFEPNPAEHLPPREIAAY